ncbi:hypothetical protein [Bradyrhizobium sp. AZCC 1610]|uniref:hypothetical protein n=1 Tax=Bradyrhizobium sp. AZCC 1610 TaxID=3117020 RepID=UPI002FF2B83D
MSAKYREQDRFLGIEVMKSAPGDSSQAIGEIGDGNAHMGNRLRNTLPRDVHSTEAKNQAAEFPLTRSSLTGWLQSEPA